MTRIVHQVEIGRVLLRGVTLGPTGGDELRAIVEAAIAARLADAPLPAGRTVSAGVRLRSVTLSLASATGTRQVARVVADGVAGAVGGPGGRRA